MRIANSQFVDWHVIRRFASCLVASVARHVGGYTGETLFTCNVYVVSNYNVFVMSKCGEVTKS